MKIIKQGKMPDGTPIQIENWHEDYSFEPENSNIAAYPKSPIIQYDRPFGAKYGRPVRIELSFRSAEEAQTAYDNLVSGRKTLYDYRNLADPKYRDCIPKPDKRKEMERG